MSVYPCSIVSNEEDNFQTPEDNALKIFLSGMKYVLNSARAL